MRSRAIHRWNSKTAFTLASFFCLFLFGLFDSLKGSTLSTLLKDLNLNYSPGVPCMEQAACEEWRENGSDSGHGRQHI